MTGNEPKCLIVHFLMAIKKKIIDSWAKGRMVK